MFYVIIPFCCYFLYLIVVEIKVEKQLNQTIEKDKVPKINYFKGEQPKDIGSLRVWANKKLNSSIDRYIIAYKYSKIYFYIACILTSIIFIILSR